MTNENIFQNYCKEASLYPLLTCDEEVSLAKKIAKGDAKAKQTLINANLRLVIKIARKAHRGNLPILDLIQEGNVGLMIAAKKFNPTFCVRFSTYAYYWISQYIRRAIHAEANIISIPEDKMELFCRIKRAHDELSKLYGSEPGEKEIAQYLGISVEKVHKISRVVWNVLSLDEKYNESTDATFAQVLADTRVGPEEKTIGVCLKEQLQNTIETLPSKEKNAMKMRYDFTTLSKRPLTKAKRFCKTKVSVESIRTHEIKALTLLREKKEFADILFS